MADIKKAWKQTAKSFILAFNDLGVSLAESAKLGIDKAVEWARKDNPHYEAEGAEVPTPEEPVAEAAPEDDAEPANEAEPAAETTASAE
ncbi:MAG: hypothetical protein IJR57_09635 [Ruminococcus sp.]|nr:hypothetical protein [Ruminococcus sp.]